MSLVADYSSDASSSDEEITTTAVNTEKQKNNSIFSILPPPKVTSKSKKDGPVKIVVDLPQDDFEEEKNISKKQKISTSSSLFSLLTAPKRTITKPITTTQDASKTTNFVPHAITKKKPIIPTKSDNSLDSDKIEIKQANTKNEDDIEDANTITESFFPLGPELANKKSINGTKDARNASAASITIGDNVDSYAIAGASNVTDFSHPTEEYTYDEYYNNGQWQENASSYIEYQGIYDESQQQIESEQTQSNWELDDEMFQKLGGRRGKREGPIKIKEINAADQMADSWQSQVADLSKPTRGSSEGSGRLKPTRGQKRKHNLMYLAFHATAMENELKEQHASNKKTKRETQAKYGF